MGNYSTHLNAQTNTKESKVLLLGLDYAGKTALLYRMTGNPNSIELQIPTIGFSTENCAVGSVKITCWDVGGRGKIRALWRHYYQGTKCVVFVVDSNDRDRLSEIKHEMEIVLQAEELSDCSVLILANKQDLPNAMSPTEIAERLELKKWMRQKSWDVFGTVATTKKGAKDVMQWIQEQS